MARNGILVPFLDALDQLIEVFNIFGSIGREILLIVLIIVSESRD